MTLFQLERAWGGCGRLPLGCSLRALLQVMSELRKLHDRLAEAHGEVTPQHIVLSRDGSVSLTAPSHVPLVTGFPMRYLAPERLRDAPLDPRADVFSLGVMLWEALAGKPLSHLTTRDELMLRWREEAAPPAPVRSQELWAASLAHVAARALAIDPAQRYASVRQLQNALETLAGRHFANVDAWTAMFLGARATSQGSRALTQNASETPHTKRSHELSQLPDLSRLWGQRAGEHRHDNEDTMFDLGAGPPELESVPALPVATSVEPVEPVEARRAPELADDELPTRFLEVLADKPVAPPPFKGRPGYGAARAKAVRLRPAREAVRTSPAPDTTAVPAPTAATESRIGVWLIVVLAALLLGTAASLLRS